MRSGWDNVLLSVRLEAWFLSCWQRDPVGTAWSKQVAPQRGQAPGPLIHSTLPLVPTGPWAASTSMDMITRFGRQNSLGRTNKKEQVSTMTEYDPKQVIIDYLSLPEGEIISQPDPDTPA